jgi:hypothetical protein
MYNLISWLGFYLSPNSKLRLEAMVFATERVACYLVGGEAIGFYKGLDDGRDVVIKMVHRTHRTRDLSRSRGVLQVLPVSCNKTFTTPRDSECAHRLMRYHAHFLSQL